VEGAVYTRESRKSKAPWFMSGLPAYFSVRAFCTTTSPVGRFW
jgi:hypothetical protein